MKDDVTRTPADARAAQALAALDRRAFLRGLGLAAAAGALPSGCQATPGALAPPEGLELHYLSPRTYAVLTAAAERMAGPRGAQLIRRGSVRPGEHVEAFLGSAPALASVLQQALLALEFGIYPLLAKLRPFTALEAEARDFVLADCMGSRFALKRRLFGGVRAVSLLGFYRARESHALLHYPMATGIPTVSIEEAMGYDVELGARRLSARIRRRVE